MEKLDKEKALEYHVFQIMDILGVELNPNNSETPKRVSKMYVRELFANVCTPMSELDKQMTMFPAPNQNIVVVKNIKFTSMCEHHWLPFTGYADIEYIPTEFIIGLSKIPRVVKFFSKKPQVQERLTQEIGDYLVQVIKPKYLKVTLRDVRHSCVEIRGVESECSTDTKFIFGSK